MSSMRKDWVAAKAVAKKNGLDVTKAFSKLPDFGPMLDNVDLAEKAYDAGMKKLAMAPDRAKERQLRDAVNTAVANARRAGASYVAALNEIKENPAPGANLGPVDALLNAWMGIERELIASEKR